MKPLKELRLLQSLLGWVPAKWFGWRPGLSAPRLRIYQQLVLLLLLLVVLPLSLSGVAIYQITKVALRKELTGFSEQFAGELYQELASEMRWQRQQAQLLYRAWPGTTNLPLGRATQLHHAQPSAEQAEFLFGLDPQLQALAVYGAEGQPVLTHYRDYAHVLPEHRLPKRWQPPEAQPPKEQTKTKAGQAQKQHVEWLHFEVLYQAGEASLRAYLRAEGSDVLFLFQRRFPTLERLIARAQEPLKDGLFLVDAKGQLLASSEAGLSFNQPKRLSDKDWQFFQALAPGVAQVTETNVPEGWQLLEGLTVGAVEPSSPLETVFIKMPDTGWGLIVESPYHVRQDYIRQAKNQMTLIILAVVVLVLVLGLLYVVGIVRNFRQLIKGMKAITQGNYNRKLRLLSNYATPYEIIYVAGEFNRMVHRIAQQWETIQAANQQLAQLDALKSHLIDSVSHELRTPLTNIKGYTSRLLRHGDDLSPEVRTRSLEVIKQQSDRLSRLVDDLLVIPDLEEQRLRLALEPVDLLASLERARLSVQGSHAKAFERGEARLSLPELEAPIYVLADPDRLEQVWLNLFENALKYASSPQLEVRAEPPLEGWITLRVMNPAEPIEAEALPKLFQKFHRLDDSLTRTTRGSGLGLYITKELVEAMEGEIALAYEDGQFQVVLRFKSTS